MTEVLIAQIIEVNDFGIGKAIANGIEWKVYRTVKKEVLTEKIRGGQYIACSVKYDEDNDEFYLHRLDDNYLRAEMEWIEQENNNS